MSQYTTSLYFDTCGPMEVDTPGGLRYAMLGVDCYTRHVSLHLCKRKSDADECLFATIAAAERKHGKGCVQEVHFDGGEFLSDASLQRLKEMGILATWTAADTPAHNGVVERMNKTIVSMARCMLIHSGLPKKYWGEAMRYATIITNVSPSKAIIGDSPYEM